MICRNGHFNSENQKFCGECGETLQVNEPSLSPPPPALSHVRANEAAVTPANRRTRRPAVIGGIALIAIVGLILGLTLIGGGDEKITVRGIYILKTALSDIVDDDFSFTGQWDNCSGDGGYDDVNQGAYISVRDEDSKLVGSSSLENASTSNLDDLVKLNEVNQWWGEIEGDSSAADEIEKGLTSMADLGAACYLYFEVEVLKRDFYEFTFAGRNPISYSHEQLRAKDFTVGVSLGGD
jgi:hypothetical protein